MGLIGWLWQCIWMTLFLIHQRKLRRGGKRKVTGLIPINPTESKEARASAIATLWEAHNVYIPAPEICPWVQDFTAELLSFPAGVHDDQVDSMTQALSDLQTGGRISADNMAALRVRR